MTSTLETKHVDLGRRERFVQDELTAVEAALRKLVPSEMEDRFLAQIPQWFLLLRLFKDMEVSYTCLSDKTSVEVRYRAALTSLMAWGENIWSGLNSQPDLDISPIGMTRKVIELNVRYLREKYDQWFGAQESDDFATALEVLGNERTNAA